MNALWSSLFGLPLPQSDVVAIVMDIGIAHVCSITEHMTLERARIDVPVPKKRAGGSGYAV